MDDAEVLRAVFAMVFISLELFQNENLKIKHDLFASYVNNCGSFVWFVQYD